MLTIAAFLLIHCNSARCLVLKFQSIFLLMHLESVLILLSELAPIKVIVATIPPAKNWQLSLAGPIIITMRTVMMQRF